MNEIEFKELSERKDVRVTAELIKQRPDARGMWRGVFEYRVVNLAQGKVTEDTLNDLGASGWELRGFTTDEAGNWRGILMRLCDLSRLGSIVIVDRNGVDYEEFILHSGSEMPRWPDGRLVPVPD